MTKPTLKEINKIIAHCELNQLCIKGIFAEMLAGTKQWDEEKGEMIDVAPKLTKPEQEAKELRDAAESAVSEIMSREKSSDFSADFIKREAAKMFTDLYIAKPKLFKQAVQAVIAERDKASGQERSEKKPILKESEINPAHKDWAEKHGIEIEPLPPQQPV